MSQVNGTLVRGWDSIDSGVDACEFVAPERNRNASVSDKLVDAFVALSAARRDVSSLSRIQEKYSLRSTAILEARKEINLQTLSALQDIVGS
jgi:phosphatidylserine/phosphatidylglycerophosphate/cardiolipin synthase-like enzyme